MKKYEAKPDYCAPKRNDVVGVGSGGGGNDCPKKVEQSQVEKWLNSLQYDIEELNKIINELEGKLVDVLREPSIPVGQTEQEVELVPLADNLRKLCDMAQSINRKVLSISTRLEL